jgi:hypothetical protein
VGRGSPGKYCRPGENGTLVFGGLAALHKAKRSGGVRRADRPQSALAETLGIALTGLRLRDDALSQRRTNGVVGARGGAERGQRHLKGNPHLTGCFVVELMAVEIRSDGHGKQLIAPKFHSTNVRIVKWPSRRNQQICPAFTPWGRRNAFVSDLPKRAGFFACPRCKAPMKEVVWITPIQNDPGLIAYECPTCDYLTSVLIDHQSDDQ